MLNSIKLLFGLIVGSVSPLGIAVTGYFVLFAGLPWVYLATWFVIWAGSVLLFCFTAPRENRYAVYYDLLSGGFGWVYAASGFASIWFAIAAIFMDGSWWEFGYSLIVGTICKGWTQSFHSAAQSEMAAGGSRQNWEDPSESASAQNSATSPYDIVADFGKLIETSDGLSINDISELPHPKQDIVNALIYVYQNQEATETKEMMKIGLMEVARYQEDVKGKPVRGVFDASAIQDTTDVQSLAGQIVSQSEGIDEQLYDKLSKKADSEYQEYLKLLDQ
tara:strand:+ start:219 stop:1049 length:831 start_codon:yes stop_codon:yes gene_type:complete